MAKKKSGKNSKKSSKPTSSQTNQVEEVQYKNWKEQIEQTDITKENFNYESAYIVESNENCFTLIDEFNKHAETIDQSKIRIISHENLACITTGSVSTKNLGDLAPVMKKAVADAKAEMKKNGMISTELEALLIKLIVLIIRNNYLSHKENYYELQKALEQQYNSLLQGGEEGKKKGKGKGKAKGKEKKDKGSKKGKKDKDSKKGKKDKGKTTSDICAPINAMVDSNITDIKRKMKTLKQSEDFKEPEEGIDLYFAFTKLYNYELIKELQKIGVKITALIDISTTDKAFSTNIYHKTPIEAELSDQEVRQIDISNFWRACGIAKGSVLFKLPKNTCYLRYIPKENEISETIYTDLLRIVQNLNDLRRLHKEYLESLNVLDVEETKKPIKIWCLNMYNKILEKVPNEFQSVPVILDALLEEVAKRVPGAVPDKNTDCQPELYKDQPPNKQKVHSGPRNQLQELFNKIEKKESIRSLPSKVTVCKTKTIPYGNPLQYQLSQAPFSTDLKSINIEAFKKIKPLQLFNYCPKQETEKIVTYNYLFYKWAKEFDMTPTTRLMHCIHAYLLSHGKFFDPPEPLEYIPARNIGDVLFLDTKPYNESYEEDPVVNFTYLLSKKIRKSIKFTGNVSETKSRVNYCEYYEEYDPETMIQMVKMAYENIPHYDCKFFPGHDTILIRFTNKYKEEKLNELNYIRTPVCFRDFCGHVLSRDTDWLYVQEYIYWNKKIVEKEVKREISMNEIYTYDEKDFILPGSIKERVQREKDEEGKVLSKKSKLSPKGSKRSKGSKESKKSKGSKGSKGSKESKVKKKAKSEKKITSEEIVVEEQPKLPTYEGYNLNDILTQLTTNTQSCCTPDGFKIAVEKYRWSKGSQNITIKVLINDNIMLFHLRQKRGLLCCNPLSFQLNLVNGILMKFDTPEPIKTFVPPCDKRIATYKYVKPITSKKSLVASTSVEDKMMVSKESIIPRTLQKVESGVYIKNKKDILQKIKTAIQNNMPIFKICSSRLHKFLYVQRKKSHIEIPVGKVIKRLTYKPKIRTKLSRHYTVHKCQPSVKQDCFSINMEFCWRASLPTGLFVQALEGPEKKVYIKQGYIVDRTDTPTIENEDYRCFMQGKVISFLKNGEVVTMHVNKTYEHRQYGYFSSNVTKNNEIELRKISKSSYHIHKGIKDTTRMERKIKKICQRLAPKLINLSSNYHLESKCAALKNEKLTCKLSRQLHEKYPSVLPLLKLITITEDGSKTIATTKNVIKEEKKYFITHYNDYLKRETLMYREDGTSWYLNNKGYATTQFPDSTRITTWATILDECLYFEDSFEFSPESYGEMNYYEDYDERLYKYAEPQKRFSEEIDSYQMAEDDYFNEPFVLCGLNYKYEHPNYVTVTENCTDDSIEITMPDDIKVYVYQDGTYNLKLTKKENIYINSDSVTIGNKSCERCDSYTGCDIFIRTLNLKSLKERDNDHFLRLTDRNNKLITIDLSGNLKEEQLENEAFGLCHCKKETIDRYFVLRRDLSGAELFAKQKANRFAFILDNFEAEDISDDTRQETSTHLIKYLYKTYTEHLMMIYDLPFLGMLNNYSDSEEIFKVFDYDEKNIILLRNPLYLIERKIYHLCFYKYVESFASGFHYFLQQPGTYINFKPSKYLANFIKKYSEKTEEIINEPQIQPRKLTKRSSLIKPRKKCNKQNLLDAIRKNKELIDEDVPKYFDSRDGSIFLIINSCIEKALEISETNKNKEGLKPEILKQQGVAQQSAEEETVSQKSSNDLIDAYCNCYDYGEEQSKVLSYVKHIEEASDTMGELSNPNEILTDSKSSFSKEITSNLPTEVYSSDITLCKCGEELIQKQISDRSITTGINTKEIHATPKGSVYCNPQLCCPNNSNISLCKRVNISPAPSLEEGKNSLNADKIIIIDIIHSLKNASPNNNINELSKKKMYATILSQLKYIPLTVERAANLTKELTFALDDCQSKLYTTAIEVLDEMKEDVHSNLEDQEKNSTGTASGTLQNLALKASVLMYNVLDNCNSDTRLQGKNEIQNLFEEANLSPNQINAVLDMTAEELIYDLSGSAHYMGIKSSRMIPIKPQTATLIIETLQKIMNKMLDQTDNIRFFRKTLSSRRTLVSNISDGTHRTPKQKKLRSKDTITSKNKPCKESLSSDDALKVMKRSSDFTDAVKKRKSFENKASYLRYKSNCDK